MTDIEEVVFAFLGIAVTRNIVKMLLIEISVLSACEHLMAVALVGNIVNYLINGRVENIVKGYRSFDHTEIRSEMSAVLAESEKERLSHFCGKSFQLLGIQLFYIVRGV